MTFASKDRINIYFNVTCKVCQIAPPPARVAKQGYDFLSSHKNFMIYFDRLCSEISVNSGNSNS